MIHTLTHMTSIPAPLDPEDRFIASVKALRGAQGVSVPEVCTRLGISRATWFKRMSDGQFTLGEMVALSELFGASVQSMIDGIGLKGPLPKPGAILRILAGGGRLTRHANRPLLNTVPLSQVAVDV